MEEQDVKDVKEKAEGDTPLPLSRGERAEAMEKYHFYGDAVSAYEIGGREEMLHPGQEVSLPPEDKKVKALVKQGLLVKYEIHKKTI